VNHRFLPSPVRASRAALTLLAATQFLLVLDSAIVNVALPSMRADLAFTARGITWVVNAYALLFGGLLLFGGRLADVVGARRVFLSGVSLFAAASVAGALAHTAGALVVSRALQGIGAAMTAPAAMALVMVMFTAGPARNRALGAMGAAAGLGGASGALLGGLLTETWGWPAVLWINVPVGVLIVTGAIRHLPTAAPRTSPASLDLGGAVTATGAVVALVFGLIGASGTGSPPGHTVVPVLAAAVLAALFVRVERRAADPLLPPSLLGVRGLRSANVTVLFSAMAMMPMWFLLTVYMQAVRGYGPVAAGAGVIPTVVMLVVFNSLAHRVIARVGLRTPLVLGLLVAAAGMAWTSDLGPQTSFVGDLLWSQLLTGLGFGLAFVAGTVSATSQVPLERSGVAAGVYNTSQQVGGAIGLAVLAAVTAGAGGGDPTALTANLSLAFRVAAGFAAVAAVMAWVSPGVASAGVGSRLRAAPPPSGASSGLAGRRRQRTVEPSRRARWSASSTISNATSRSLTLLCWETRVR
jgi:EmrB/QacA subfamily drug resistance transporter